MTKRAKGKAPKVLWVSTGNWAGGEPCIVSIKENSVRDCPSLPKNKCLSRKHCKAVKYVRAKGRVKG